jgi:hypothetical protein
MELYLGNKTICAATKDEQDGKVVYNVEFADGIGKILPEDEFNQYFVEMTQEQTDMIVDVIANTMDEQFDEMFADAVESLNEEAILDESESEDDVLDEEELDITTPSEADDFKPEEEEK